MGIDIDFVKQLEDITTWFLGLPQKLISATVGAQEDYHTRRERVQKQKELAEIREVGKVIQDLYFSKGNLFVLLNVMQMERDAELAQEFRHLFGSIMGSLDEIRASINETPISNTVLGSDISFHVGLARAAHESIFNFPDEAFFDDRHLFEIIRLAEAFRETGARVLGEVDHHRASLDLHYGNESNVV